MPITVVFFSSFVSNELLSRSTIQVNSLSYIAFAKASLAYMASSRFNGLVTTSKLASIVRWVKAFFSCCRSQPNSYKCSPWVNWLIGMLLAFTLLTASTPSSFIILALPSDSENPVLPKFKTLATMRNMSSCISSVNSVIFRAFLTSR